MYWRWVDQLDQLAIYFCRQWSSRLKGWLRLAPRGESMQGGRGGTAQRRVQKERCAGTGLLAEVVMNGALGVNNLERVNEGAEQNGVGVNEDESLSTESRKEGQPRFYLLNSSTTSFPTKTR